MGVVWRTTGKTEMIRKNGNIGFIEFLFFRNHRMKNLIFSFSVLFRFFRCYSFFLFANLGILMISKEVLHG